MSTLDVPQGPKDAVSPMLVDNIPASMGHFATTHTWVIDSTTLLPVGIRQSVQTGTAGVHEIGA